MSQSARGLGRELPTNVALPSVYDKDKLSARGGAIGGAPYCVPSSTSMLPPTSGVAAASSSAATATAYDVPRARSVSVEHRASSTARSGSAGGYSSASSSSSANGAAPGYIAMPQSFPVDPRSPRLDHAHRTEPSRASELGQDVVDMLHKREQAPQCNPAYLASQPEVHEKMRTILIDWFVDVALKFKLHPESYFLAVNVVDRYLSGAPVPRTQLQLVGITAVWIASKYEEMWAPTVAECVSITANTYTRDEVLKMERTILAALQFKLTVPTSYQLLARLLDVIEADAAMRNAALFYLEHAVLDYKYLQFLPSQLANAALYLANLTLRKPDAWPFMLQYYSKAQVADFRACAQNLLEFVTLIASSKYQAIRRKYSSSKYGEVARLPFPEEVPSPAV
jgi:cyclin A